MAESRALSCSSAGASGSPLGHEGTAEAPSATAAVSRDGRELQAGSSAAPPGGGEGCASDVVGTDGDADCTAVATANAAAATVAGNSVCSKSEAPFPTSASASSLHVASQASSPLEEALRLPAWSGTASAAVALWTGTQGSGASAVLVARDGAGGGVVAVVVWMRSSRSSSSHPWAQVLEMGAFTTCGALRMEFCGAEEPAVNPDCDEMGA